MARRNGKENAPPVPATAPRAPVVVPVTVPVVPVPTPAAGQSESGDASTLPPAAETEAAAAERAIHQGFIKEALDMARLALRTNETPVGCVLVNNGVVVARGMNATNKTRNGTRHAEYMALSALLSDAETAAELHPYGQRVVAHAFPPTPTDEEEKERRRVDRAFVRDYVLYVTVEPCIMCASMLRQFGVRKVYFGAVNDKFGGTGGVFRVHDNSDGGVVGRGFEAEGGWGRDEAVGLLRRFYVQENGRAPVPRKKDGRAARLAATMKLACVSSPPPDLDLDACGDEGTDETDERTGERDTV